MRIDRKFVTEGADPFTLFNYDIYHCALKHHATGEVILDLPGCVVPSHWSLNARNTLISKYFRKAGIPQNTRPSDDKEFRFVPDWLKPRVAINPELVGPEHDVRDIVRRLVGHWTFEGFTSGYFEPDADQIKQDCNEEEALSLEVLIPSLRESNARAYFDEMVYLLLAQGGAPNSPQWFNTGLWWAYGITGTPQGHWRVELPAFTNKSVIPDTIAAPTLKQAQDTLLVKQSASAYRHVQAHACYILSVEDSMMAENGIVQWYEREARIFKYGSGGGANLSKLRGKGEPLSIGGTSSGMLSWKEVADRSAGAIKSGGTTRRAAKMVCLDLDHPDIEAFIDCKVESEVVVAAMVAGAGKINHYCQAIIDHVVNDQDATATTDKARDAGVPENYIHKAVSLAEQGIKTWPTFKFTPDFDGRAYAIAPFQNANNSVRIPSEFYRAVDADGAWNLKWRTNGQTIKSVSARELDRRIAEAAWFCGDPGIQYDTIINDWNVTPKDGRINGSNPCSEHMRIDGSACNLASERLMVFFSEGRFDAVAFCHATELWVLTLDITNTMAHLPDKQTAMNVFLYRDIGLGFADLGALLLAHGLAYDSDEGRALAGFVAALMQGQAHLTSAKLAREMGAYPRFWANRQDHLRCVRNHIAACNFDGVSEFEGLTVPAVRIQWEDLSRALGSEYKEFGDLLEAVWEEALELGEDFGFRNAELTVIAPTGTIGITMDCDTTGVEPLFALMVFKQLVGGGTMNFMPSASVSLGLKRLGYSEAEINSIIEQIVASHGDISDTVRPQHRKVFETAMGSPSVPAIPWEAHIKMMGAVQSFISGAISKTVNMPAEATVADIQASYRLGHDLSTKAIAVYRDQSKLSQPMTVKEKKVEAPAPKAVKAAKLVSPPNLDTRVRLGWNRVAGIDLAVPIGPSTLYLRTTRYDDGKCAEIWATYSGVSDMVQSLVGQLCKTANVALQYGVPLSAIVNSWVDSNFWPNGFVTHPFIKNARSVVNLMARLLDYHELGNTDRLTIQPKADLSEADAAAVSQELASDVDAYADAKITGEQCPECGSQQYVQNGSSCKKCLECGSSGSCG